MISVSIRYFDFTNMVRSQTIHEYTNEESILMETAMLLFDKHYNGLPIRHLGISLGSLYSADKTIDQMSIYKVLEELNKLMPDAHLICAAQASAKKDEK